jgi:hypothetical protein
MLATYCTLLNGEASIHKESHGALSTKHTWTLHFLSANLLRSNAHAKWKLQGTMRQLEMLHTHTHLRFKNPPVLRRRCVCIVALAMQVCFDRWIERWYHEYLPSPAHRRPSTKQLMMPCARTSSPCDWMSCNLSDHLIASHRKLGMLLSSCGKTYRP